ncbi:MAG: hypothetical protein QOK48_3560 [Blastocatellia bacterium]|nr:hypothetical protein [Blastocatellia bacterium]
MNTIATEFMQTGIDVVGAVPWGTHFCNFYETKQDLLDTLIPYFKAGLENKEFCLWVVSSSELITVKEAGEALAEVVPDFSRYLAAGQIEVLNAGDWYLEDNVFNLERVASAWEARLEQALALGFNGMRVSGDTFWLRENDWKDFRAYEKQINESISDRPMTLLCTYPLTRSGAALVLEVAKTHQFAIVRRQGEWEVIESPELLQARVEIARHQRAEDELRRQKEILQKVFDNVPVMIASVGVDGRPELFNREWERTIGWSMTEIQENNVDPFVECFPDPQYRQKFRDFIMAANSKWEDFKVKVRDGRIIDMNAIVVRLLDGTRLGIARDTTERKRADAQLHAREQEFRAIVENAPDQIIRYDREFRRTYVNPAVVRAYGLPEEALIGQPIGSVIRDAGLNVNDDELARVRQRIADVFETGESFKYEMTWPTPKGLKHYSVRLFPELDLSGSVVNVLGISRDITERKEVEDALRRSEDHLRLVIDTIPTMAWSLRPDGVLDYLNQRWLDYTGLSFAEAIEEPTRTVHPEDLSRATEKWLAAKATSEMYEDEMRLRRADGEYRWFLIRIAPLRDEQGKLVKWYGVSFDIEDRKQAEEQLKHSETQLAQAQRLAHIGSWDWDLRTNAVTWSDELYHIFGLQPGTINAAEEVDRFIHPDDLDLGWNTVKRAVANKQPYDYYHRILRPDGTERIARSRGAIMCDELGEPIKVFGATQDVTDLKRAEEKLKATSDQLRALSARMESAREEEGIRIAREIHDELGSSLTRLKWDLEIMGKEGLAAEDQVCLGNSRRKISEMIALVDETVDTVRRISAELRPSALDDLGLGAALRLQARQFQDRTGIIVECDCSAESVKLTSQQSTAVFRICEEALTNVMRHSYATRVEVKLKIDQGDLVVTIRDNGTGITPLEMSDSLSLGLLGMRERAHLLGGEIEITGIEDKGTVVTARVPIQGKVE